MTSETGAIDIDLSGVSNAELVAYVGLCDTLAGQAPQEGRRFLHVLARAFIAELHRREGGEPPGVASVEVSPETAAFASRLQQGLGLTMLIREHVLEARRQAQAGLDAFDVGDIMCFVAGWQPPSTDFDRKQSRWLTWEEFDAEYEIVRAEFLAEEWTEPGKIAFAEARYEARHA